MARLHHPDKHPENIPAATEKFKLIAEAYSVVGDPAKRRQYDLRTSAFGSDMKDFNMKDAEDLFKNVTFRDYTQC